MFSKFFYFEISTTGSNSLFSDFGKVSAVFIILSSSFNLFLLRDSLSYRPQPLTHSAVSALAAVKTFHFSASPQCYAFFTSNSQKHILTGATLLCRSEFSAETSILQESVSSPLPTHHAFPRSTQTRHKS